MSYKNELKGNNDDLRAILETVNSLPEAGGGAKLPELTNPASASDIVRNKEAIDGEGNVITGNILDGGVGSTHTFVSSKAEPQMMNAGGFDIMSTVNFCSASGQNDMVLRKTSPVKMTVNGQTFGDAQPSDVAAGKTFTSLYGLKETGTAAVATDVTVKINAKTVSFPVVIFYCDPETGGLGDLEVEAGTSATLVVPKNSGIAVVCWGATTTPYISASGSSVSVASGKVTLGAADHPAIFQVVTGDCSMSVRG